MTWGSPARGTSTHQPATSATLAFSRAGLQLRQTAPQILDLETPQCDLPLQDVDLHPTTWPSAERTRTSCSAGVPPNVPPTLRSKSSPLKNFVTFSQASSGSESSLGPPLPWSRARGCCSARRSRALADAQKSASGDVLCLIYIRLRTSSRAYLANSYLGHGDPRGRAWSGGIISLLLDIQNHGKRTWQCVESVSAKHVSAHVLSNTQGQASKLHRSTITTPARTESQGTLSVLPGKRRSTEWIGSASQGTVGSAAAPMPLTGP